MNRQQQELNEKLSYTIKCNQWKELKVRGDIKAIVEITNLTCVTVSKAVNHGIGSLELLRQIDKYFEDRSDSLPQKTEYFSATRRNPIT